jgi:transposase
LAQVCGIETPDAIPHKSTFSRFFAKLSKRAYLHLVKDVSRALVRHSFATLPGFGQRVALDSTTLKAWSNGGKAKKSDPDAGWSIKKGTQGVREFTYGYKLHLLVDCEYELPIAAHVSAGNVHDAKRASNVLSEAQFTMHGKFRPKFIMADKGYSGKPIQDLVRHYWAKPIIDVNAAHERLARRTEKKRATPEWKALYRQRIAVERVNSRLKGQRALNRITVRRRAKVTVHCYLALIAAQTCVSSSASSQKASR